MAVAVAEEISEDPQIPIQFDSSCVKVNAFYSNCLCAASSRLGGNTRFRKHVVKTKLRIIGRNITILLHIIGRTIPLHSLSSPTYLRLLGLGQSFRLTLITFLFYILSSQIIASLTVQNFAT